MILTPAIYGGRTPCCVAHVVLYVSAGCRGGALQVLRGLLDRKRYTIGVSYSASTALLSAGMCQAMLDAAMKFGLVDIAMELVEF